MARKGGRKHLKRPATPPYWPIQRKKWKWTVKPRAGPHSTVRSIPLAMITRDVLHLARSGRESSLLISGGKIKVDGRIRTDHKYPVGLMDVVEIPEAKVSLRVVPTPKRNLGLIEIPREESSFKLCRIDQKRTVAQGHIQLNLHDARNLLVEIQDPRRPTEDPYSIGDTIQLSIPDQKMARHMKLNEGSYVVVTGGHNIGRHGTISRMEPGSATRRTMVEITGSEGGSFRTTREYVFVVGDTSPIIRLAG